MRIQGIWRTLGLGVLFFVSQASAYEIHATPTRFPDGQFTIYSDLIHPSLGTAGVTAPVTTWDDALFDAAGLWNTGSVGLSYITIITGSYEDTCDNGDGEHGVDFTTDLCGDDFGSATLATARRTFSGTVVVEGNISFKESVSWDVYDGNLKTARDFQRVAVHELGHLLGLGHESTGSAIMAPSIGNLYQPQTDDLDGIAAIYTNTCPTYIKAGNEVINSSFEFTDCFGSEAGLAKPSISGLTDSSVALDAYVRIYRLTMEETGTIELDLTSPDFNSAIYILDSSLTTNLKSGWASTGNTASISYTASPGTYYAVARSVLRGKVGDYTLTIVPEPSETLLLIVAMTSLIGLKRLRRRK